eukprot:s641_g7.t1
MWSGMAPLLLLLGSLQSYALAREAVRKGDLLLVHENLNFSDPLSQAIQATGLATIKWLREHGNPVSGHDTAMHVGIAADGDTIIEAQDVGVRQSNLTEWLSSFPAHVTFFVGEVQQVDDEVRNEAVAFARSKLGVPYAVDFEPPEVDGKYYCSSLVDYAYRHALKSRLVFTKTDMPLIWEPLDFWKDYYRQMNKTLPNYNGSNPTMLLQSDRVKYWQLNFSALRSDHQWKAFDTRIQWVDLLSAPMPQSFQHMPWHEQAPLMYLGLVPSVLEGLQSMPSMPGPLSAGYDSHVVLLRQRALNSYPQELVQKTKHALPHDGFEEGDLVISFNGCSSVLGREYCEDMYQRYHDESIVRLENQGAQNEAMTSGFQREMLLSALDLFQDPFQRCALDLENQKLRHSLKTDKTNQVAAPCCAHFVQCSEHL